MSSVSQKCSSTSHQDAPVSQKCSSTSHQDVLFFKSAHPLSSNSDPWSGVNCQGSELDELGRWMSAHSSIFIHLLSEMCSSTSHRDAPVSQKCSSTSHRDAPVSQKCSSTSHRDVLFFKSAHPLSSNSDPCCGLRITHLIGQCA